MKFRTFASLYSLLPICLLSGLTACDKAAQVPPPEPPEVLTARPLKRDIPIIAEVIGQTEATANVEVRARVEGTVDKILFIEGSRVKKGDPLFLLDKEPIRQRLAAAQGQLGQAKANMGRVKQDVERLTPLAKSGAVPQKDLDTSLAELRQTQAAVDTAQAQVTSAEIDLGYAEINAPVSGIIGAKQVDQGSLVGKGQATVMAIISPLNPIWANVEVSEVIYLNNAADFKDPSKSPEFALVLANGKPHPHLGKLAFVDRLVNAATATLRIRVEFPNPDEVVRPGQFCRIRVATKHFAGSLLLPQRAVQEQQGRHNVFVVNADGKATYCQVEVGERVGSLWIVSSGLKEDDEVVIEGLQMVRDGTPVKTSPFTIDDTPVKDLLASVPGASPTVPPLPEAAKPGVQN